MAFVYDVGVHYTDGTAEKALAYMQECAGTIEERKGKVLHTDEPEHTKLAYTILGKTIGREGVYPRHTHSYFFTLRCEFPDPDSREFLDKKLSQDDAVIRHLLVKTEKDAARIDPDLLRDTEKKRKGGGEKRKADQSEGAAEQVEKKVTASLDAPGDGEKNERE